MRTRILPCSGSGRAYIRPKVQVDSLIVSRKELRVGGIYINADKDKFEILELYYQTPPVLSAYKNHRKKGFIHFKVTFHTGVTLDMTLPAIKFAGVYKARRDDFL